MTGDQILTIANPGKPDFIIKINDLKRRVENSRIRSDSLVKNVSYENQKIADVERRIAFIRDSMDNSIDEDIYKPFIFSHLNSPLGLY